MEDIAAFIRFLKDYASKQNAPPVLIPCHDSYLEVIDEHLEEPRAHYLIPQNVSGIYSDMMNKEILQRLSLKNGVCVPETVRVNEDGFSQKFDYAIKYPCIVKPTDSPSFVAKFRRKLFKANNRAELEQALEYLPGADRRQPRASQNRTRIRTAYSGTVTKICLLYAITSRRAS